MSDMYLDVLQVRTGSVWSEGVQAIGSKWNAICIGVFDMCEPMISELLVYSVYVRSAIAFYLAWLTCANREFLNHWYIGYMFEVQ